METLINVLAVAAILMTLLLGYFVVMTIYRGLSGRFGASERMPLWPGCPVAWLGVNKEILLNEDHEEWSTGKEDLSWRDIIVNNIPENALEKPVVKNIDQSGTLLFLPSKNRGVKGWWVIKLQEEE